MIFFYNGGYYLYETGCDILLVISFLYNFFFSILSFKIRFFLLLLLKKKFYIFLFYLFFF